jgi:uncharacterized protein (DUF58 family)
MAPTLVASAAIAVLLAAIAVIAGNLVIALMALPLIVAVSIGWDRLPAADDQLSTRLTLTDAGGGHVAYRLETTLPERVAAVVVRQSLLGAEPRELVLAGPQAGELAGEVALLHSGPQEVVRFELRLLGDEQAAISLPEDPIVGELVVAPASTRVRSLPLPVRLQGMTGTHESARLGDGGEFRDIHPFSPGDRLRRIDWRATARLGMNAGELYVRRTNALADATVLIVMDSRDDVGEEVAEWSRNAAGKKGLSSLDVAREAASSLAGAYIAAGDRVGFQDLSSRARMIAHAGGTRHLWKLARAIEVTAPSQVPFRHRRAPIVPPGALVYLLSSLLDDQPVDLALRWLSGGHRVIAVDVLPPPRFVRADRRQRIAHRMIMMARDDRIRTLRSHGVELLRWATDEGALPLAARLELLSRPVRRRGSRAVRR